MAKHTTCALVRLLMLLALCTAEPARRSSSSQTILFTTVGRAHFAFDIYTLPLDSADTDNAVAELRATDGISVNYNGHFITGRIVADLRQRLNMTAEADTDDSDSTALAFISERAGLPEIHISLTTADPPRDRGVAMEGRGGTAAGVGGGLSGAVRLADVAGADPGVRMEDRPCICGDSIVYVSTMQPAGSPRNGWTAVYAMAAATGATRRLTPTGVADFSPAASPSGEWVAVASTGDRPWNGEIHDLATDIYVFRASDGSGRRLLVRDGGWPAWADNRTLFFHRSCADGWWSIYKAVLGRDGVTTERVTPSGFHAFTPAAHRGGRWVALATRRLDSDFRHIEILDVRTGKLRHLTRRHNAERHHYNPFFLGDRVGYHRCRGNRARVPRLERLRSPVPGLSLARVDGEFPTVSPDGSLIAFIGDDMSGLWVMHPDGTGARQLLAGAAFATSWGPGGDVIYTGRGEGFSDESTVVHIVAVHNVSGETRLRKLTRDGTGNNAFPWPSPDGRWLVFRSGRSGYKNLYIMDAAVGEQEGGIRRLTDGAWTDTMPSWSPDGRWIAFASDREHPGSGEFSVYLVRPDGSGLRRAVYSGGRVNHASFSPDSRSLVFTTDYAAVSAEPISTPNQFQPYGEIFITALPDEQEERTDSAPAFMQRLTHNAFEDGTPFWSAFALPMQPPTTRAGLCGFDDQHWLSPGYIDDALVQVYPQCRASYIK